MVFISYLCKELFYALPTGAHSLFYDTEMEIIKTEIDGVVIIEPRIFKDARGYFFESFHSASLTKR